MALGASAPIAGVLRSTAVAAIASEEWDLVLDVNLKGTFLCAQASTRRWRAAATSPPLERAWALPAPLLRQRDSFVRQNVL